MKHEVTHKGTPVQAYRHPTPVEMQLAIHAALREVYDDGIPIPVRVFSAIDKGVSDACITAGLPS